MITNSRNDEDVNSTADILCSQPSEFRLEYAAYQFHQDPNCHPARLQQVAHVVVERPLGVTLASFSEAQIQQWSRTDVAIHENFFFTPKDYS